MVLYARRLLQRQPQRLLLTIMAIALCAVMMQFLLASYQGVSDGSVEYIRKNVCDLWVMQRNTTNLLRGTSFLTSAHGDALRASSRVRTASPVLLLLPTLHAGRRSSTIFLAGYEVSAGRGGPPEMVEGRAIAGDDEIVLDRSFGMKLGIVPGDTVRIQESRLVVTGLSEGTNAFVIQYGFVTLACAQRIAGIPDLVSLYIIDLTGGSDVHAVARDLEREVGSIAVFPHATFLDNNLKEMESGFLPLLFAIAGIGVVVMTIILSLLLSITILERRKDLAIMKTLGAPRGYLPGGVALLALLLALLGIVAATLLYPLLVGIVESLSPEISTQTTLPHVVLVVAICVTISQVSAMLAMRRLRSIYALEVFR